MLTRSRSRHNADREARSKHSLRDGEHARELLFLRRHRAPPRWRSPCSLLEAQLALHVAEEQDANARLVQLKPQFLQHHVAPRTLHPKFWCFLVALERRSAELVVRRSASLSPARARPRRRCRRGTCLRAARSDTLRTRALGIAGGRASTGGSAKLPPTLFKSTPNPQSTSLYFSHPSFRADSRGTLRGSRRLALLR